MTELLIENNHLKTLILYTNNNMGRNFLLNTLNNDDDTHNNN